MRLLRDQHVSNFLALVVSAVAASLAPLQVFIFVYAFVGPLHYLTEIAWLKKKDFYFGGGVVSERAYVAIAAVLCVAVSVDFYIHRGLTGYAIGILMVLSLGALVKNPYILTSALVAGYVAKFFVHGLVMFVSAILPTIVHVYVFTMLFMVSGLVRERKKPGLAWGGWTRWINPLLLLGLPVVLLMARWRYPTPGSYWINAEAGFSSLHGYLARLLGRNLHPDASILADPAAAGVLRFLAFIYLFHYLNWFAKTELLQWHRVSRRSWVWIAVLYSVSVGCYLRSFMVGFYLVNFLSMLHVFLEFPLNWHTGRFLATSVARLWSRPEPEQVAV
ncbi:MAG TPA: hypothetical protein VNY74_09215 [Edaphobacter sp.]|nr:hypothetical protein [Edaphobacter sp.]